MTRTGRLLPLLAVVLLVLSACGGNANGDDDGGTDPGSAVPDGMVLVRTDVGTVARPEEWTPVEDAEVADRVAGFVIEDDGQVVGQMDVFVNETAAGTGADTLAGAIQGARMPNFPDLRHTRREFTDVPGADGAFLTESTYTTADTGQDARSLDQVAIAEDGRYLLVRISAADEAYDEELFQQVVDTMRLETSNAS